MRYHRILIAIANNAVRTHVRKALAKDGFLCLTEARNGLEALDLITREHPELLVYEVNLPKVSGWQMCRLLKAEDYQRYFQKMQALLISPDFDDPQGQSLAFEAGAAALLQGPLSDDRVVRTVRALLSDGGAREKSPGFFSRGTVAAICEKGEDRDRIRFALSREGYRLVLSEFEGREEAIAKEKPQVVLFDLGEAGPEKIDALRETSEWAPEAFIVALTTAPGTEAFLEIIKAGASDCLKKPADLERLARAVNQAMNQRRLKWVSEQFNEQLEEKSRLELALRRTRALEKTRRNMVAGVHRALSMEIKRPESALEGDEADATTNNAAFSNGLKFELESLERNLSDIARSSDDECDAAPAAVIRMTELMGDLMKLLADEGEGLDRKTSLRIKAEPGTETFLGNRARLKTALYLCRAGVREIFGSGEPVEIRAETRAAERGAVRIRIELFLSRPQTAETFSRNVFEHLAGRSQEENGRDDAGIVLSIARTAMKQHGGELRVESFKGAGVSLTLEWTGTKA